MELTTTSDLPNQSFRNETIEKIKQEARNALSMLCTPTEKPKCWDPRRHLNKPPAKKIQLVNVVHPSHEQMSMSGIWDYKCPMQFLMTLSNWYAKLTKSLVNRDFKPSHIDPRLYHSWTICERHRLPCRVLKYECENFILTNNADDPKNFLSWTEMVIIGVLAQWSQISIFGIF